MDTELKCFFFIIAYFVLQEDPRKNTDRSREVPTRPDAMILKSADTLGPLPDGWESRVHADGRVFYINHGRYKSFISTSQMVWYR